MAVKVMIYLCCYYLKQGFSIVFMSLAVQHTHTHTSKDPFVIRFAVRDSQRKIKVEFGDNIGVKKDLWAEQCFGH